MSFGYVANWHGSSGTPYVTSGISEGGIPAKPDFSFKVSDLAKLTFEVTGNTEGGTNGTWSIDQVTGCWLGELSGTRLIGIPSRRTQFVSAAPWQINVEPRALARVSCRNWQFIAVERHGSYWLAEIHDPPAGFVSLRAMVTDVQGDRSVETVYRACGVSTSQ
ncbi:MAG TPA: hypothetical protein VN695_18440 [Streptosporangiaceae bacterium]|nr:hypothetical protein [Streptosporangiaceae bacterium]